VTRARSYTDNVEFSPQDATRSDPDFLMAICRAAVEAGATGIVLTNTTIDYSVLPGVEPRGGLSGRVLRKRSFEVLRLVAGQLAGRGVLISVGGIESAAEVYARLKAGANLVQLYTAMVYEGPLLVSRILRGLLELMEKDGVSGLEEVTGADI